MPKINPHLWFDKEASKAAEFYVSVFPNSKIIHSSILHNTPGGDTEIVSFELDGNPFQAISAGPMFKFSEAISFVIHCKDQKEVDYYWDKLSADPKAEQCGWLKDKFGLSWQVVPKAFEVMMGSGTPEQIGRVTQAFLQMKKFDIATLEKTFNGN